MAMKRKEYVGNKYSPYYDHDENHMVMTIDENGSWIHVTIARELQNSRNEMIELLREAREFIENYPDLAKRIDEMLAVTK